MAKPNGAGAVMGRRRIELDERSPDFAVQFAIRLRAQLDRRKLTTAEFLEKVQAADVDVGNEAVKSWLNGTRLPRPQDLPKIGAALGMKDYRNLLPGP